MKNEGEQLFDMLTDVVLAEANGSTNGLIQPLVSQVNLTTCRAKPQLVYRLASKSANITNVFRLGEAR